MSYPGRGRSQSTQYTRGRGGLSLPFRRHILEREITIQSGKSRIIPLLCYQEERDSHVDNPENYPEDISNYDGVDAAIYKGVTVEAGSICRNLMLDVLVKPTAASDTVVVDYYTGRIMTSFHDLKSNEVRGVSIASADGTPSGMKKGEPYMTAGDDVGSATKSGSVNLAGPELDFDKIKFDQSITLRHWWRGIRKTVLAAGQPAVYHRMERIPRKCVRSNPGMFYGVVVMNDSDVSLDFEVKQTFNEVPILYPDDYALAGHDHN